MYVKNLKFLAIPELILLFSKVLSIFLKYKNSLAGFWLNNTFDKTLSRGF